MLPFVCIFAIPIASCLAIGTTVGNIFAKDELLLFRFFPQARKKLQIAVWSFAVVLAVIFIPLLFQWAPQGYWQGKRFLLKAMHLQIEGLPPKQFHSIASRGTIFFRDKDQTAKGNTKFTNILLMMRQKNKKQYLVVATFGVLHQGFLELFDGTIYTNETQSHYIATFQSLEIDFERMFLDAENNALKPVRFATFRELVKAKDKRDDSWKELHKRLAQILWQLLLPFLVFLSMMLWSRNRSNLLLSVLVSGGLFLGSYVSVNMAYFFLQRSLWSLVIFYGIPIGITSVLWLWYKRIWR